MQVNHMVGITPAGEANWDLVWDAGIRWLRMGVGFPFEDRVGGRLREGFSKQLDRLKRLADRGFRIMGDSPTPGSSRYDAQKKQTSWQSSMPSWAGSHEEDRYYEMLEASCVEMADRTKGICLYWQISNEPDIDIFRGPLNDEQIIRFLLASARGVKKGNPSAQCGINLGGPNDKAKMLARAIYRIEDSPFDYVGLDGYFGSWQRGGPTNWPAYIDEAHAITGKPVIINEWGYSSLQEGPITDDPERKKPYNQDVCRNKRWGKVWRERHSPEEQAEYLSECIRIFAEHPKVIGNFFFRYGDTPTCWQCGQPECPAECAWGMVDTAGNPKLAYHALKQANRTHFGV